jgi:methylsterol monooxygenase
VYWALGLIFMAFDMNDTLHSYVQRFKIQPDRRVTWAEYRQVLRCVVKNQVFVNLPLIYIVARFSPLDTSSNLPGWWKTFGVYFGCMFCEEAGFYGVHRLVHHPKLYARVHKMHHQFTAPVAFASTYCTMAEQTFVSAPWISSGASAAADTSPTSARSRSASSSCARTGRS